MGRKSLRLVEKENEGKNLIPETLNTLKRIRCIVMQASGNSTDILKVPTYLQVQRVKTFNCCLNHLKRCSSSFLLCKVVDVAAPGSDVTRQSRNNTLHVGTSMAARHGGVVLKSFQP